MYIPGSQKILKARDGFRDPAEQFVGGLGDLEQLVKVHERNHSQAQEDRKRQANHQVMETADWKLTLKATDSEEASPAQPVQAAMAQNMLDGTEIKREYV